MPFFHGVTGRVYYRHWQAANPRAAVAFLHGFGEHTGVYHRFGAALDAAGIDLWALDEIGHGLTEGPRGQIDSLDDLVVNGQRLTDRAAASDLPLIMAGHSLGAVAATLSGLDHQDRYQAVVLTGAPLSEPEWFRQLTQSTDTAGDAGGQEFSLDLDDLSADPFYRDSLENDPLAFTEADVVEVLRRVLPPAWERIAAELGSLTIPVLAINGELDPIAPAADVARMAASHACITAKTYPGMKHDILNETRHREVAAAIIAFIEEAIS